MTVKMIQEMNGEYKVTLFVCFVQLKKRATPGMNRAAPAKI